MKLGATITSERGKPVNKTGNEHIIIQLNNSKKQRYDIYFDEDKITMFDVREQKEVLRKENENLKHDTIACIECGYPDGDASHTCE